MFKMSVSKMSVSSALAGTLLLGALMTSAAAGPQSIGYDKPPAGHRFDGCGGNAIARNACRDRGADAYYYNIAYADAFERPEYGRRYSWRNPYNGHRGYIVPMHERDVGNRGSGPCREFKQFTVMDGRRGEAYGTACPQGDGSWRILNV
jgi:17 kDa outer membrane surface antigen